MLKKKLRNKIDRNIDGLEESLKYVQESQSELLSGLQTIRYLLYLIDTLGREDLDE